MKTIKTIILVFAGATMGMAQSVSSLVINGNEAKRWGGGLYVGISPPWYNASFPLKSLCEAKVTANNATYFCNVASWSAGQCLLIPAQIACERVGGTSAVLSFDGAFVTGDTSADIGIYAWDSIEPSRNSVFYGVLGEEYISEEP